MKILLFIYQWFVICPIMLVLTMLTAIITIFGCLFGMQKFAAHYPPMLWSRLFCILMWVKVDIRGQENIDSKTSYVFVANHQGAYDIFSIYGYMTHQFKWMMKKSLERIPLVGLACKRAGHIMVDKSSASAIKQTMEQAKMTLKEGMSLVVFPEGARSWTGKMRDFKRGAFKLATDFNLPIVPITIDGSFNVMPRSTYNIKPGRIVLTIHKPIYTKDGIHDIDEVMKESFDAIQSALPQKYKR